MKNLFIIFVFIFSIPFFSQPANNDCSNAETIIVITANVTDVNMNTNTATDSGTDTNCEDNSFTYLDQWYTFTMPVNGNIKITNADFYDFYTLYDTCNGTEISCFPKDGFFYSLTSGTTYTLRISNRDSFARTGIFKIQAFETAANNDCTNAENITVTISATDVNVNTNAATDSGMDTACESVGYTYLDQWYTFTMPVNGNIKITNTDFYDFYTLYDACNGNEISCFPKDGFFYSLTSGTIYTLRFSNRDSFARTGIFKIQAFETAANNDCGNAENIIVTTSSTIDVNVNTNAANDSGTDTNCEDNSFTYLDQWYTFTMPASGNIKITNTDFYDFYTLYDTCNGTEISCFPKDGFFYSLTSGTTYTLRISNRDSFSRTGIFKIQAFETAANNDCSNAESIVVTTTNPTDVNVNTNAATDSGTDTNCENNSFTYLDQWYTFTMPVNGNIKITNIDYYDFYTLYDTCNGTEISCFPRNNFFYSLTAGTTYTLRFSNRNSNARTGIFKIQAFETVANNNCSNAESIVVTTSVTDVNVNTNAATDSGTDTNCESNSFTYLDQWYTFTMPVSGNIKITNTNFYDFYTLYDTCNGTEISCFPRNDVFYSLTSGTTYTLRFSNRSNNARTGIFNIQVIETATNDVCADAINLTVGTYNEYTETKTLFGASPSNPLPPTPSCGTLGSGEDVWFTVQVPNSGKLTIETTQATSSTLNDTVLQAFTGNCTSLTEIACDDNSASGNFSRIELSGLTPADTIYIRVFENGSDIADYYSIYAFDNNCNGTTNWDGGSWSNGTPDNTKIAVFDADYNTNTANIDACMCKINAGNTITVNANQYVKLDNNLYNYGNLDLTHQASFVQVDDTAQIIGNGNFSTEIQTTTLDDSDRFTYIASPVQYQIFTVFNSWANMDRIWQFNGSLQDWELIPNINLSMEIGKGYAIKGKDGFDYSNGIIGTSTFTGKFNNGVITQNLFYHTGGIDDDNILVGNPYPSAIAIASLLDNSVNPDANSVYVWTHNSPIVSGAYENDDYIVCSATTCTSAYAGNDVNNLNGYLASGQGFFVDATASNATLTFNNSMRVTGNNDDFRRPTNNEQIWINLSSDLGYFNQIALNFTPNGSTGFDKKLDAIRLGDYYGIGFYSVGENNDRLAINDYGVFTDEISIPIGYYINDIQVNTLKINIDHLNNMDGVSVYLKDNLLNIMHDLKLSDYTYTNSQTGIYNNRFELLFNRSTLDVYQENTNNEQLIVKIHDSNLYLHTSNSSVIKEIKIYDILGKELWHSKHQNTSVILDANIKQGTVLFFKVKLENGTILQTKFIKI